MLIATKNLLLDLENKEFTDCTFVFNENGTAKTISAHKTVLASASSVFKKAFYGELKELGSIDIVDIPFEAFQKMIWIIYGKTTDPASPEEACQLYYAAQKYDVLEPLTVARNYMIKNMSQSTAKLFHAATVLHDDAEIIKGCHSKILEKTFDTTKKKGFFDSTEPLEGDEVTFGITESEDGTALKVSIEDFLSKIQSVEDKLDIEGPFIKTLELIRILTSETKKAFESIVPETMAKFVCSLNWVPPTSTVEVFNAACNNQIRPGMTVQCAKGHTNTLNPAKRLCLSCGIILDSRPKTYGVTSKYNEQDCSAFVLNDIKEMYEKLKSFLK